MWSADRLKGNKQEPLTDLPLMGFGTFIGIEVGAISDETERKKVTADSIFNALSVGYRHLDLAENYGNLEAVSHALKMAFQSKSKGGLGLKREDIWLTIKADLPFNEAHINNLLKKVGVEYFDLFLIHHCQGLFDSENKLEKHWQNLANIDKQKLKRIGVSNFYEPHLSRLLAICAKRDLVKPYANEIELNILAKNATVVNYCNEHQVKLIAYSPLGYGFSGMLLENTALLELANKINATSAQGALAWLMAKGIAVIPKTTQQQRLEENYLATHFIDAVLENNKLSGALDEEPDFDEEGLSQTAIDSKLHSKKLTWEVQINKPRM